MPNALAYLMLFGWPLVMLVLMLRLPLHKALIWSLLGAYLLLPPQPAGIKFPLISSLNKETLTVIALAMLAFWRHGSEVFQLPKNRLARLLMLVFVIVPVFTTLTNREPLFFPEGPDVPGLKWNDALGLCIKQALVLTPFLLAYNALNRRETIRSLLAAMVIACLFYSVLMLIEVRLSPQLNYWIYGYYQHLFSQTVRAGGFRPVVFLEHGLWLAFFAMTACLAALSLWRATPPPGRAMYMLAFLYLAAVLFLAKSLGAMLFAVVLTPMIVLLGRKAQMTVAMLIALVVLSYPLLRTVDIFPTEKLVAQAAKLSPERAHSLEFRFDNEDDLLARANEKPVFGWGSWGRNQLHDSTGKITSVTDGRWIITFGVYGWIGFLAEFGLLTLPLLLLRRAVVREQIGKSVVIGALALILAVNVLDLLPNATLTPMTWVITGALLGYADRVLLEYKAPDPKAKEARWTPIL